MAPNRKHTFTRNRLYQCIRVASGLSLIAIGSSNVIAQDSAESNALVLEEVTVTAQRTSIQNALAIKQDADQVVDAISAIDIGALPDRSVAEALQRVPGVQLQRTSDKRDPARLSSEGGGVMVRGLSWVRTELNGRDIFSASGGRTLGFDDVSADLMAGVDVFKNATAEQIEGGIGGSVNLRTRMPLEQSERIAALSLDYNDAELFDKGFTSGNGLFSDRWNVGEGEIGVLLSASITEIGTRTDSIQVGRYQGYDVDGSGVYIPAGVGFRRVDWEQERNSYNAVVQWAVNENLTLTAQGFFAQSNAEDIENNVFIQDRWGDLSPDNGVYQYDANNNAVRGVIPESSMSFNTRYGDKESSVGDYSLKIEYIASDNWSFSGDLQYVKSEAEVLSMTSFTGIVDDPQTGLPTTTFDLNGDSPTISVSDQERLAQADQYWWAAAMDHLQDNEADSLAVRADAQYVFENNEFLQNFRFGARLTDKDAITRQTGYNWSLLSNQYWLNNSTENTTFLSTTDGISELFTYDNFMRGDINVPSVGWFGTRDLVSSNIGANKYFSKIVANNGQGWGWSPLIAPDAYNLDPRGDNVSAGINQQNEKTSAFYSTIRFGDELGNMLGLPFDGNFGIRIVKTDVDAIGRSVAGGVSESCAGNPTDDCVRGQAFVNAYMAQLSEYKNFKNSYTNVLPSLNLRFFLQEDLQLRLGLSRAMVRPEFSHTRPYTTVSLSYQGDAFDPTSSGAVGTATGGNPALKPTIADQVDGSIEWYFDESASLTLALFYKDIKDYVALVTQNEQFSYGGETLTIETTRQINAGTGKIKGFEIAYQQFYDMLPSPFDGLGLQANFTYIDNTGGVNTAVNPFEAPQQSGAMDETLPIEGMSKTSYNLALMYEKYDISARLAYNWRERYLLTTSAANLNRPVWFDDYGQLDGSIFYSVNDNLKLGLQITNLLEERTFLSVSGDNPVDARYSWTDSDRRTAFVMRYKF